MRTDQYGEFVTIMNRAALLTYHQKGKDWQQFVMTMFEELAQYELPDIENAVSFHVQHDKFLPTLSDIIRRIDGSPEGRAASAWAIVLNAIRHIGGYNSVAFPAPAYNYALSQLGGWIEFCSSLREDNIKWQGISFERIFVLGDCRASWDDVPGKIRVERYCVGRFEIHNRMNEYTLPEVIDARTRRPIAGFRAALQAFASRETKIAPVAIALADIENPANRK